MSIDPISANPARINPQVKADQAASAPQVSQDAEKTVQTATTDTVTISSQAVQMLESDGDAAAKEVTEKAAEKASEKLKGKK